MTRRRVTDEQLGQLDRRITELKRRVDEGTIPFDSTMEVLQQLIQKNIFTFPVNFDDSRWKKLKGKYANVFPDLRLEHFPIIRKGKAIVTVELICLDRHTSFREELDECRRLRLPQIDRAIAETFFDAFYEEGKRGWILVPCGALVGTDDLACVRNDPRGRALELYQISRCWHPGDWFLRLREIQPLVV